MTFNAVLGSHLQTSLLTVEQASVLVSERLDTDDWDNATTAQKQAALTQASQLLLTTFPIWGEPILKEEFKHSANESYLDVTPEFVSAPFYVNFTPSLKVPKIYYATGEEHCYWSGAVTTGSSTTVFTDSTLDDEYLDDRFNYGSVVFTSGDNLYQIRTVSDYTEAGVITVSSAFGATPATDDTFILFAQMPEKILRSVVDTALILLAGKFDYRANLMRQGVTQQSVGGGESEQFGSTGGQRIKGDYIPETAARFMRCYAPMIGKVKIS